MLCDPAGGRISADERVEWIADAQVSDEYPHRRDPEREPVHDNIDRPWWCPAGLTRSQKRRVQRLRQLDIIEEEQEQILSKKGLKSQVWRVKAKADDESASDSSTPIQAVDSSESS